MKKIAFLLSHVNPEAQRLIDMATHLGAETKVILAEDVRIEIDHTLSISATFDDCDAVITRIKNADAFGMAVRTYLLYAVPELEKKMLNGTTYKNYPDFSKLLQMIILKRDGVPVPATYFSNDYSTTQLPIVLKSLNGSNGQQVHYVQTPNDLETYATQYGSGNFLLQKPLPIGADYRVIVLGNKAIGMHKKVTTSGFLTNVTAGGRVEPVEAERREHIAAIALQAARSFACEYAGVDVMYDDKGEPRILEINRGAGFNKMQEDLWQIDLAENIISYVLSK